MLSDQFWGARQSLAPSMEPIGVGTVLAPFSFSLFLSLSVNLVGGSQRPAWWGLATWVSSERNLMEAARYLSWIPIL